MTEVISNPYTGEEELHEIPDVKYSGRLFYHTGYGKPMTGNSALLVGVAFAVLGGTLLLTLLCAVGSGAAEALTMLFIGLLMTAVLFFLVVRDMRSRKLIENAYGCPRFEDEFAKLHADWCREKGEDDDLLLAVPLLYRCAVDKISGNKVNFITESIEGYHYRISMEIADVLNENEFYRGRMMYFQGRVDEHTVYVGKVNDRPRYRKEKLLAYRFIDVEELKACEWDWRILVPYNA